MEIAVTAMALPLASRSRVAAPYGIAASEQSMAEELMRKDAATRDFFLILCAPADATMSSLYS